MPGDPPEPTNPATPTDESARIAPPGDSARIAPPGDSAPQDGSAPRDGSAPPSRSGPRPSDKGDRRSSRRRQETPPDAFERWLAPLDASRWPLRALIVLVLALGATLLYSRYLGASYAVKDWLFWRILRLWGYGALLGAGCVGFGAQVLSRLPALRRLPLLEQLVMSAAVGLVGFTMGMYAGGALAWYGPAFAIALPSAMALSGALPIIRLIRLGLDARARATPQTALGALAGAFGVLCVAVVYLQAMTPAAINFDASWCHMTIGADYARAGRIIPFPGDYARDVPHLASLVHAWAFMVPGLSEPLRWMMALHNEFFFFLWTLAGVAAAARWMLDDSPVPRTWVAFFLFPAIFVYDSNLGGAADHYLAFFAPPLFLACARAAGRFETEHFVTIGVAAAGAVLTKYQASYLLFGAGLLVAGAFVYHAARRALGRGDAPPASSRDRTPPVPSWAELIVGPLVALAVGMVLAFPHFLKNWIFYRNPVYPFAQDVFRGSTPTTPNAAFLFEYLFKDWNYRPHGTLLERLKSSLELLVFFSVEPHYSFTKDVPNTGSLFTLCFPLLLFVRRPRRLWTGMLVALGSLFLWAFTFRIDRNLQIMMPLLAAVTAATLVRAWQLGWVARAGIVPLVALQVIWGGDAMFYSGHERLKASIDLIRGGYEGKRDDRLSFRKDYKDIEKALPPDAVAVLHNYRPTLGINRTILLDWAGQQGLILYEGLKTPREMYDYWRARGVTHLLNIPARRPASTKAEDVLFHAFVSRYGKVSRVRGWEVIELPKTPPPEEHGYRVVSIGLSGYRDGLYPVESMQTYDRLPKHLLSYPAPAAPLPAGAEGAALLADADAVIVGKSAKPDAAVTAELAKSFSTAVTFRRAFTLYLRKSTAAPTIEAPPKRAPDATPPAAAEPDEIDDAPEQ